MFEDVPRLHPLVPMPIPTPTPILIPILSRQLGSVLAFDSLGTPLLAPPCHPLLDPVSGRAANSLVCGCDGEKRTGKTGLCFDSGKGGGVVRGSGRRGV